MGGKSQSNAPMIRQQEEQAAEARAKEAARQGRLTQGLAGIRAAFEGAPVMGSRQVYKAPTTTYTDVATPGKAGGYTESDRGRRVYSAGTPSTTTRKASTTPGGYENESYDTGERSGGFGDSFFNRFRQAALDWYMPQVERQRKEAADELTYGLARAGTGRSSAAVDETAKLAEQDRIARAQVISQADTGVADLRKRVAQERANAEAQLYATENPEVAANSALSAVKNISLAQPEMGPLGQVFQTALVGGANALTGYKNEKMYQDYGLKPRTGSSIVPSR